MEPQQRTDRDRSTSLLIPLAVGILTLLAVVGAAAHSGIRLSDRGPLADQRGPLIATGVLLLFVDVLVIAAIRRAMRRRRQRPEVEMPRFDQEVGEEPWWVKVLTYVILFALIALPVLLIYLAIRDKEVEPINEEGLPPQTEPPNLELPEGSALTDAAITIMMLLSLAAIVVAVIVTRRQLGPSHRFRRPQLDADPDGFGVDEEMLEQVVNAGEAAIHSVTDPRQAIIACYSAMEATLAAHGARRRAADTPGELLDRAAAAGLVRSDAAGALTDLFRRARFSGHLIPEDAVAAARVALIRLRTDIGVRT